MSQFRAQASFLQITGQWQCLAILLLALGVLFAACPAYCTYYYVAPDGNDLNDGSIDYPFKTITKAVEMVLAGDNIFLRGGQHDYINTINISKSGAAGNLIILQAYQDEIPILDFSGQQRISNYRGIQLSGNYWHFKGFTVRYSADNGVYVDGSYNVFEQLVLHSNGDSGLQLYASSSASPAYNEVINCDSYLNYDPYKEGENADGFAAKGPSPPSARDIGPGNVFRGCRAWNNSDDGWDFWYAGNGVTVEDCGSFRNGVNLWVVPDPNFNGDGNGFKLGKGGGAHVLKRCVAYDNRVRGIDINGNETGVTVHNCTCVDNGVYDFHFDASAGDHVLRNNLSYLGEVEMDSGVDHQYNSWNGFSVSASDFVSLDPNFDPIEDPDEYTNVDSNGIDRPREPDGGLPALSFLRLTWSSSLVDGGIDVGEPFEGDAPDLGAFERWYGDCEPDGDIDLADLECLVANWLDSDCGECNGADFDGDGEVNLYDFAALAGNWLKY